MPDQKILQIAVENVTKEEVLEQIRKNITQKGGFLHIVSLNPEIFVLTTESEEFKRAVTKAQIKLVDGVGTVIAGRWLGVPLGDRLRGVDMVEEVIRLADNMRLRIALIGARDNLAVRLADCYQQSYKNAKFIGFEGFNDVMHPTNEEIDHLRSIVADFMPQIVFVAFGSPMQELFIERNRALFAHCVCMGVGGAFDFLSGQVPRAPKLLRQLGLEWLFRLVIQPWRWRRQLRLFKFIYLVFKQKISGF